MLGSTPVVLGFEEIYVPVKFKFCGLMQFSSLIKYSKFSKKKCIFLFWQRVTLFPVLWKKNMYIQCLAAPTTYNFSKDVCKQTIFKLFL